MDYILYEIHTWHLESVWEVANWNDENSASLCERKHILHPSSFEWVKMKTFLIPQGLLTEEEHVARNVTAMRYSINPLFLVSKGAEVCVYSLGLWN